MSKKILILRGGPSPEYEISLKTGKNVFESLSKKYLVTDCIIDKNGDWFVKGLKVLPQNILRNHDLVFNAMHGDFGEDGQIQEILERFGVKFTGPKSLGARLSINKKTSKKFFSDHGLKTPIHKIVNRLDNNGSIEQTAISIFRTFAMPVILKPVDKGSSLGVTIARDFNSLFNSLLSLFVEHDNLLVEEYIVGKEATVGVIEEFRNQKHYALLPVEIKAKDFFDYNSKYLNETDHICPGNFSEAEKKMLQELAIKAHQILNLRHYSRSDFIIHPKRGIYILETNSLPGLTDKCIFPKSLSAIGLNYDQFLDHIINLN